MTALSSLLDLPVYVWSGISRILVALACVYAGLRYLEAKNSPLNSIPTIGYSGILTSYITAVKWMFKGAELLQEGYSKYPCRPFKVATMSRWIIVLSGEKHIDDIRKASSDVLSFYDAVAETVQADYTFGPGLGAHPYHINTIRSLLTRNLGSQFHALRDEIIQSFDHYIPPSEGWVAIPAFETILHIVCRVTNRYLVGLPLCRDPGYCTLNEQLTIDVVLGARVINCFPDFLKPLVGKYLTTVPKRIKEAIQYLGPTIEERLTQQKEYGPDRDSDLPNDLVTWLLETATHDYHRTVRDLVMRILIVNFAAVHTSSMSITQGVYDLAVHPEYVDELRKEVEDVVAEHGWTRDAVQRMHKIDSFLKESQRLNGSAKLAVVRKTLVDWTLSDGTLIPAGTFVGVAADAMSKDEDVFEDAQTFKGLRFVEMALKDAQVDPVKHQMVCLNNEQIIFGLGRHACPGRFLAVNEIKTMLAHIVINYDVQLENGSLKRPPNFNFETSAVPNTKAIVSFRRRAQRSDE